MSNLEDISISPDSTIRHAMERMTDAKTGIVLLVHNNNELFGVLTDGDIRRAIIAGSGLETPIGDWATREPVTAEPETSPEDLIRMMQVQRKLALPVVDSTRRLVGVEFLSNLIRPDIMDNYAVIMAGGYGKRMRSYTKRLPKPMLKVDAKPIIEVIVERLAQQGITNIVLLLHHMADVISDHFRGRKFGGNEVEFLVEDKPLGTAGGLSLIRQHLTKPFLVLNGDSLIRANWRNMLLAHESQQNEITIGASEYTMQIPYGVLESDGGQVTAITEKPTMTWLTVCSVYCISPSVLDLVEDDRSFDLPELIQGVLDRGGRVGHFTITDVTRIEDLIPSHGEIWEAQS